MPTPTYFPLANITLGASASSVTFSSIPATYRDLIMIINGTFSGSGPLEAELYINGSTSDYSFVQMTGDGSSTSSSTGVNPSIIMSSDPSINIVQLMDYSATDKHKTILIRDNIAANRVRASAIRWAQTAAITSLQLTDNAGRSLLAGTTVSLYGIAS